MDKGSDLYKKGLSIVVCCHNSAARLTQTLQAIASLKDVQDFPHELIVVDNQSDDGTSQIAAGLIASLRIQNAKVVHEPRLGLSYARKRGVAESSYEYVSFIDDDNWVDEEWVGNVQDIMENIPEIGACGSCNSPAFEREPPIWFHSYARCYALGAQGLEGGGDVTETRGDLYGAGLTVRRTALNELDRQGFKTILTDRTGAALNSGGDSELCMVLRLSGWRLWYEPSLRLKHYIPKERLRWKYLRGLFRGFGVASVGMDPYWYALGAAPERWKQLLYLRWWSQLSIAVKNFVWASIRLVSSTRKEGSAHILVWEQSRGRIQELFRIKSQYDKRFDMVRNAPWRLGA